MPPGPHTTEAGSPSDDADAAVNRRRLDQRLSFLFSALEAMAPARSQSSLLCRHEFLLWMPFCFLKLFLSSVTPTSL